MLNEGQGQNKIVDADLHNVGIAIHAIQFVEKSLHLLGTAHKVVPLSEDRSENLC